MSDDRQNNRLPRNFHRTFKPERQYIAAMLRFAASGKEGDHQAIASATGIPTGSSSGKAPAILDYCRGMGLIRLLGEDRSAVKRPELTPFGRVVLLEDPYLKVNVTQWLAHIALCSSTSGADAWYQTFFAGTHCLGMSFSRAALETHLSAVYGVDRAGLIGPLVGMYEDDAAFRTCGALSELSGNISRKPAPLDDMFGNAYGAWIISLICEHFPRNRQVTTSELDSRAGWRTIPGWDLGTHQRVLELIERKGILDVDRHMDPWLLQPKLAPEAAWKRIYDDLL
jgi:hypothetical protein